MKTKIFFQVLLTSLTIISSQLSAQGYYPLEIGNMWEYYDIYEPEYGFTTRAITDTLMPNNQTYTLLQNEGELNLPFYFRQSESKVYDYSSQFETELLIFDFSKTAGDTVSVYYMENDTIVTTVLNNGVHNIFGEERLFWQFLQEFLPTTFHEIWQVTDSIGLTSFQCEVSPLYLLRGAIIDGTTYGTITSIEPFGVSYPKRYILFQNYPNPFNNSTIINLKITEEEYVAVTIYDILGRQIRILFEGKIRSDLKQIVWDGKNELGKEVGSGTYIYRVQNKHFIDSKKMILLR